MKSAEILILAALASNPDADATPPKSPDIQKELPAPNQTLCGELNHMKESLYTSYGELPFLEMITTRYGANLLMFANPKTASWTVLAIDKANNKACLIDVGVEMKPSLEGVK